MTLNEIPVDRITRVAVILELLTRSNAGTINELKTEGMKMSEEEVQDAFCKWGSTASVIIESVDS